MQRFEAADKIVCAKYFETGCSFATTSEGKTIKGQLIPAGTSVGANYRAACRGRSRAEFIAKLGVVEEEADETAFWLELIIEGALLKENRVKPLLEEANELTRITASSSISASRKVRANRQLAIGNRQ